MTRTALLVFPADDPAGAAAEAGCAAAGWAWERSAQPALALMRLIRPAAGSPPVDLLVVAAAAGGLGPVGLLKAARSRPGSIDLPLLVVGAATPPDLPRCQVVAAGEAQAIAAAIRTVDAPAQATAPAHGGEALLDPAVIEMLRSLPGLWDRALAAFANDLPGHVGDIERAAGAGDLQGLHRVAHSLKGSAGSLGARTLHEALGRLDQAAIRGDAAQVAALLPAIRPLADRSLAALRRIAP